MRKEGSGDDDDDYGVDFHVTVQVEERGVEKLKVESLKVFFLKGGDRWRRQILMRKGTRIGTGKGGREEMLLRLW